MLCGDFGADVGFEAGFLRCRVKAGGAVDAIDVRESHGGAILAAREVDIFLGDHAPRRKLNADRAWSSM